MTNSSIKVIFLTSSSSQEKIKKLLQTVHAHYVEKKFLYIVADDPKVSEYVDNLLWQQPKESFMPHGLTSSPNYWITICTNQNIPNNGAALFNLTQEPLHVCLPTCKIFEFDASPIPGQKKIFEKKYKFYQECGYHLISL